MAGSTNFHKILDNWLAVGGQAATAPPPGSARESAPVREIPLTGFSQVFRGVMMSSIIIDDFHFFTRAQIMQIQVTLKLNIAFGVL